MPVILPRWRSATLPFVFVAFGLSTSARADDDCVPAYEGAQEARRAGDLIRSRTELQTCERTCPKKLAVDCSTWAREVAAEIPTIRLTATDDTGKPITAARVILDGTAIGTVPIAPVEVNPGEHTVVFESATGARITSVVRVPAGSYAHPVSVHFDAASAPLPAQPSRVGPFVLGGLGVVSLAAGGALAIKGHLDRTSLFNSCAPHCDKGTKVDPIVAEWTAGGVLMGVGAALLGGATLWWARSDAPQQVRTALVPTPQGLVLLGQF